VTINEAVRALRKHVGKTQQIFATELGISISSLNNYERQRCPEPKQLFAFSDAAWKAGRADLANIFTLTAGKALWGDLDTAIAMDAYMMASGRGWYGWVLQEALQVCLGPDSDDQDIARTVVSALAPVVKRTGDPSVREKWPDFEKESVRRGYAREVDGQVIFGETPIQGGKTQK
jgi:transcriptional regulator with XRE-family HTH domain